MEDGANTGYRLHRRRRRRCGRGEAFRRGIAARVLRRVGDERKREAITSPVDTDDIPLPPRLTWRRTEGAAGPRRRPPRGERSSDSSPREARSIWFPAG